MRPFGGRPGSLALPLGVDLFLAICQGLGLALATGAGGLLVPLLVAVLARAELGMKLDGSGWEFVGEIWFIALLFALNVLAFLARGREAARTPMLAALVALGAVLFAASLAEQGYAAWPGLIAGALAALLAARLAAEVLAGAAHRAGEEGTVDADGLVLLAAGAGMVLAVLSLLVPPVSLLALAALLALGASRRRRADRKHEGLRVLR